jgi:peptidoglycan hydrolase CwlO-like protein
MLKRNFFSQFVVLISGVFFLTLSLNPYVSPHQSIQAQADLHQECDHEKLEEEMYSECIEEKIEELEIKIRDAQDQAQTLANAIDITNNQIQLQQFQIAQTQTEISLLEKELANLNERIDGLSLSLDRLTDILIVRVQASYKQNRVSSIISLFTTNTFSDFVTQYKYLQQAERQIARAMQEAENQRLLYDEQKSLKEIKQELLENKREQLQAQRLELERNKSSKQKLLTDTKNDERRYQQLLAEANSQLAALRNFSSTSGSSCLSGSPGGGSDGNFYSQRDPRWCNQYIGNSKDTVGEVGCYISSMAMVFKKIGHDITPSVYAANPNNFFSNSAYMTAPSPPSGYSYKDVPYNVQTIDHELKNGRYVIAQMRMATISGMHFVVIISGENGEYTIHDPWFGSDQKLSDRYSAGLVMSLRLITQ